MSRPKLEVNEVWILQEVMPYEGTEILGVFFDPEVAKKDRKGTWRKMTDTADGSTFWSTKTERHSARYEPWLVLDQHPVRTK